MANRDEFTKPILPGKGTTDYERYLRTDELLALQKTPAELLHKDEMTFLVVHQSSELLMKGAAFELDRALEALEHADYGNTTRLIRRAIQLLEPPIGLLHILETITPYDYHQIRAGLGHGSGLDSPGFLSLLHNGPSSSAEPASPSPNFTAVTRSSSACTMSPSVFSTSTNACSCSASTISNSPSASSEAALLAPWERPWKSCSKGWKAGSTRIFGTSATRSRPPPTRRKRRPVRHRQQDV